MISRGVRFRFSIGIDYNNYLLKTARKSLRGIINTQRQIEDNPTLMEYIGEEEDPIYGMLRVYRRGRTLYKYAVFPESIADPSLHLMEVIDVTRATS